MSPQHWGPSDSRVDTDLPTCGGLVCGLVQLTSAPFQLEIPSDTLETMEKLVFPDSVTLHYVNCSDYLAGTGGGNPHLPWTVAPQVWAPPTAQPAHLEASGGTGRRDWGAEAAGEVGSKEQLQQL